MFAILGVLLTVNRLPDDNEDYDSRKLYISHPRRFDSMQTIFQLTLTDNHAYDQSYTPLSPSRPDIVERFGDILKACVEATEEISYFATKYVSIESDKGYPNTFGVPLIPQAEVDAIVWIQPPPPPPCLLSDREAPPRGTVG